MDAESNERGIVVKQMLTEVVDRGRKLHCGPWTEVVSHTTPPHLVKVKIIFDEAQKLMWKEMKWFYGLIKIIPSNHISELLKMQLESRSRNVHTSTHAVTTQKGLEAAIQLSRCKVIIALSLCLSSGAFQHTVHTSITAAKIVSLNVFFRAQLFRSGLEARSN